MQKTYDRQTAQFLAVIGQNMPELSSDVMQGWIQNPKALQTSLRTALCPPETATPFNVWKTIRLGTGLKTADEFRKALSDGNYRMGDWENDILGQPAFTASETEMEVDLVNVSVAELGFKQGVARRDIIEKALSRGLELCPAEVGPQLRLQYTDQPKGEWLLIGMEPITDSAGRSYVFSVGLDGVGQWLDVGSGYPDDIWHVDYRFVFLRPRK